MLFIGASVDRLETKDPFKLQNNFDAYVFRIDINSNINMFSTPSDQINNLKKCFAWFSDTNLTLGKQRLPIPASEDQIQDSSRNFDQSNIDASAISMKLFVNQSTQSTLMKQQPKVCG